MPSYIHAQITSTVASLRSRLHRLNKRHERALTPHPAKFSTTGPPSSSAFERGSGRKLTQQAVQVLYGLPAYSETSDVSPTAPAAPAAPAAASVAAAAACIPSSSSNMIGRESRRTPTNRMAFGEGDVRGSPRTRNNQFVAGWLESLEKAGVLGRDAEEEEEEEEEADEDWKEDWEELKGQLREAEKRKAVVTVFCHKVEEEDPSSKMWMATASPDTLTGKIRRMGHRNLAMRLREEMDHHHRMQARQSVPERSWDVGSMRARNGKAACGDVWWAI